MPVKRNKQLIQLFLKILVCWPQTESRLQEKDQLNGGEFGLTYTTLVNAFGVFNDGCEKLESGPGIWVKIREKFGIYGLGF